MKNKNVRLSKVLAAATAAFVSMPVAGQAQTKVCDALRMGRRLPARAQIEHLGPWRVLTDSNSEFSGELIASAWHVGQSDVPVRVGVELIDARSGARIDCADTDSPIISGQGVSFTLKPDSPVKTDLVGIRVVVVPVVRNAKISKKSLLPKVVGTVQMNVLVNNENIVDFKTR